MTRKNFQFNLFFRYCKTLCNDKFVHLCFVLRQRAINCQQYGINDFLVQNPTIEHDTDVMEEFFQKVKDISTFLLA